MTTERFVTYKKSPVTEVAIGVQFAEPVVDLDVLAAFSSALRSEYPGRTFQEPLPPIDERFDVPVGINLQFMLHAGARLPRVWFTSSDDRQVVQVQADRLILNWRRLDPDADYPRYDRLRAVFDQLLRMLREVVAEVHPERTELAINHVEVTYINEVEVPGSVPGGPHPGLDRILRDVTTHSGFLPGNEVATWHARYVIAAPDGGKPIGRLYASAQPGYRSADQMPIYSLTLTANRRADMLDQADINRALASGHEWTVRGFDDLVSEEMQQVWEKQTP